MKYNYCCPVCLYKANNPQSMRMRKNPDEHSCYPVHYNDRESYGLDEDDFFD